MTSYHIKCEVNVNWKDKLLELIFQLYNYITQIIKPDASLKTIGCKV